MLANESKNENEMKKVKLSLVAAMAVLFLGQTAMAQGSVKDKELNQFVSALKQIQSISQQSQQKMVQAIAEEDLSIDQFNKIRQAEMDPNQEVEASKEEISKYTKAVKSVEKIQLESNAEMEKSVKKEGLTPQRYEEIGAKVQADKDLMAKVQTMLSDNN